MTNKWLTEECIQAIVDDFNSVLNDHRDNQLDRIMEIAVLRNCYDKEAMGKASLRLSVEDRNKLRELVKSSDSASIKKNIELNTQKYNIWLKLERQKYEHKLEYTRQVNSGLVQSGCR